MTLSGSADSIGHANGRLACLYEISRLFATFTNVEKTFAPVLEIASGTLPLRSAVLVEARERDAHMFVWASAGQTAEHMRAVTAHVQRAHRYLVGAPSAGPDQVFAQTDMPPLAAPPGADPATPHRLIVLPLVVANRLPFGAFQIEGAGTLDETDLMFVNSVANQLAVALDRDHAWREEIARREQAEDGLAESEIRELDTDRHRLDAEAASGQFQALAAENARLCEEARQAVRVREQILAIVSHDLRNPLSTILMTAGSLAKKGVMPEAVARIRRAADRMLRLIEDLLDFASLEVGIMAIKVRPEDAGAIICETAAGFEAALKARGLELTTEVEPLLPPASCDRDRVLQVLSNLVGNASKATPPGGHIALGVAARGSELAFWVSDDGPGISEDDVTHLFERYWRSGQAEYRGTGLGLAISRGLVVAHGGRLWVETELGQGATFFFTNPSVAAETGLATPPA